jgi:primosomal protein N' (replication factor Y)
LDFPLLTLVGIAVADIGFNVPDFRAPERCFQLLSQVSGRAGRAREGQVLIQTYNPDHPSVVYASQHDYEGFAEAELLSRQELKYPPFGKIVLFKFSSLNKNACADFAEVFAERMHSFVARSKSSLPLEILGPVEAPIFKLRNQFRHHILVKTPREFDHSAFARMMVEWFQEVSPSGIRVSVDVDPINML